MEKRFIKTAVQTLVLTLLVLLSVIPFSCRITEEGIRVTGGDYVAPSITITMHLRNGQPYYQFIGYYIFPTTGAPAPTLDYNSTTLMSGAMTFRCDWWDECIL